MHILVADDEAVARHLFETILKDWGHTVYLATNGNEAWITLLSSTVDMVVTDWVMPEMNGLELCQKIRNAALRHAGTNEPFDDFTIMALKSRSES